MIVIVGMFYWVFVQRMEGEAALWRAAGELLAFLAATGRKNALIEIANEIDVVLDHTQMDLFTPDRQAEMIVELREKHPGFLYSTSGGAQADTGRGMPSPALVEADDYVLIHGNGLRPAGVEAAIKAIRAMPARVPGQPQADRDQRRLACGAQPGGGLAERVLVGLNRSGL
jgi:hypothetical protein